ncbi:GTP-binding protein [Stenotrophomonas mori]|uniref:ATP/GTP-binding protein n=1 Tax=Stenotrophomonas mori TaxID=2871096 RepID=A0ABT0SJG4_9GAMM|nr:ATP/GTP-binding protein [Stenotrophomonas mori]MCL7715472.1 ATP/GTP-binding protein [Stenotrophomonas mori]
MREHKIVVLGSMGSGKSTLVRSIADGAVVSTDVANSDRAAADKPATTVALDYADIDLPNGDRLRLYGTPGQQRFDFLWPILLQGARGVVVLLDAAHAQAGDELAFYLGVVARHAPGVAAVVGITRLDMIDHAPVDAWQRQAAPLPLLPLDAREREQGLWLMDMLMSEMETHELAASHG